VNRSGRLGFVPSRYGPDVVGGAETVFREMSHGLAARGWEVEILTTAARDHFTWENVYPTGEQQDDGLTVRRFPAVISTPRAERAAFENAIHNGWPLTIDDQQRWMNDDVRSPELFHYLLDHAHEYRALMFAPYMFWVTFAGSQVAPDRSILWACVHDEPYLRLELFEPMFAGVAGLWFQAEPEHELAHRVLPRLAPHQVVGCGMQVPTSYDAEGFRKRHGIDGPFILYAGRREGGKGWDRLLQGFARAVRRRALPFSLVTMGVGDVRPPADIADRVIDVGFLSDDERDDAFAAADAYIQPSQYEAFSRTIMEAWLAGTLVIANGASEVVAWHCQRSEAGLTYDDDEELEECLSFLAAAPDAAAALAARGRDYVLSNYRMDDVLDRIETTIEEWTCAS
jgi:glycosyltransferase involved in cell wall biosynthesis